jgi:hypothetical protein
MHSQHTNPIATALKWAVAVAAVLGGLATPVRAQEGAVTLRVFLDCSQCDFNNLRQDVTYINYVRDKSDADVHVLISTQNTASGGREFAMDFIGQGEFADLKQRLTFVSSGSDTEDERRRGVSRTFALGLAPFLVRTPEGDRFSLQYQRPAGVAATASAVPLNDPWNAWIFRLGASTELNGESRQSSNRLRANVSANRTTEFWKFSVSGNGDFNRSEFTLSDGRTVNSSSDSWNAGGSIVKSLGQSHWAALLRTEVRSNTQSNQKLEVRGAAGIEWDLFPYEESTRRSLVVQYSSGVSRVRYYTRTLLGKDRETLFDHRLATIVALRQPWGTWRASAAYSAFLHDYRKYNLDFFVDADVRLFRGFSLNVEGSYSRVRDQLYLAAGEATDEEVLLRLRRLQTGYRYRMLVGFSFQFGSIFNNVVNPRWSSTSGRQFGG